MELRVGQRWRTRGGSPATVEARNDGREFDSTLYPWAVRVWPMGTDMGSHVLTVTDEGRVYHDATCLGERADDLVELVEDVPVNAPLEFPKWPVSSVEEMAAAAGEVRRDWDRPGYDADTSPIGEEVFRVHAERRSDWDGLVAMVAAMPNLDPGNFNPGTAINPKDAIGASKLPLSLWPAEATALGCIGMLEGMLKYGRNNFIAGQGVIASIYVEALFRHVTAWFEGEDLTHDTKTDHLGNALACLAIIVKARAHGRLIDDRNYATLPDGARYRALIEELTPHVKRLQQMFADKTPRHFTIADIVVERKKSDDTEGGAA